MYVDDCTYTRDGKTYRRVLLRNSYRRNGKVCHDSLTDLSRCAEKEIAAIKFGLQHKNRLERLCDLGTAVSTQQGLALGVVWELPQRLGLVKALGKTREALLSLWLVFATVIARGSRLSAVRLAQQHAACEVLGLDAFHEDHLYAAMNWLAQRQDALYARYAGAVPTLYLYDVTV